MIRNLIITILLWALQTGLIGFDYVTIRTHRFPHLPYEFSIQVPADYKEVEVYMLSGQPMEIHVTFSNGGYVYLSQQKYIPNTGRIKSLGSDVYYQRFGFITGESRDIYNPNGKELVLLNNEGNDSEGLCWRDVHYIFPDSICYIPRKGRHVQVNKDCRFRLSLGYSNVQNEDKDFFDTIIESMIVRSVCEPIQPDRFSDSNWVQVDTFSPRIRRFCMMPSVDEIQKQ